MSALESLDQPVECSKSQVNGRYFPYEDAKISKGEVFILGETPHSKSTLEFGALDASKVPKRSPEETDHDWTIRKHTYMMRCKLEHLVAVPSSNVQNSILEQFKIWCQELRYINNSVEESARFEAIQLMFDECKLNHEVPVSRGMANIFQRIGLRYKEA